MAEKQFIWNGGEKMRPLQVKRACSCGCDQREGDKGVGYLTGSDDEGNGFTVWIGDEAVYHRLAGALALAWDDEGNGGGA